MTFHAYSNSHIGHLQWNDGRNSSVSECDTFFEHLLCCFCPHFDIFFITHSILPVDPPTIRLLGAPQIDVEEGKDSLVLRCEADANPPASIVWKRAGRSEIASLQVSKMLIIFSPIFLSSFSMSLPFIDVPWTPWFAHHWKAKNSISSETTTMSTTETQPTL